MCVHEDKGVASIPTTCRLIEVHVHRYSSLTGPSSKLLAISAQRLNSLALVLVTRITHRGEG